MIDRTAAKARGITHGQGPVQIGLGVAYGLNHILALAKARGNGSGERAACSVVVVCVYGLLVLVNLGAERHQVAQPLFHVSLVGTQETLLLLYLALHTGTLVAQSRGALRRDECSRIFSCGLVLMTAVSLLLTVIVIPTGGWLIALFGAGEEACAIGSAFFLRLASFYIVFGLANAIRGYIEGMGDVRFSSLAGIISLLVRIAGSYAMRPLFGNMVIAWAEALAWCLLLAMYIVRIPHAGRLLRGAA